MRWCLFQTVGFSLSDIPLVTYFPTLAVVHLHTLFLLWMLTVNYCSISEPRSLSITETNVLATVFTLWVTNRGPEFMPSTHMIISLPYMDSEGDELLTSYKVMVSLHKSMNTFNLVIHAMFTRLFCLSHSFIQYHHRFHCHHRHTPNLIITPLLPINITISVDSLPLSVICWTFRFVLLL